MNYQSLLSKHPLISDQVNQRELAVVLRELQAVLHAERPGAVVEFGCYQGTTSLFLRRLLDQDQSEQRRELHVYDSFAGLPVKQAADQSVAGDQFQAGELLTSKKQLLQEFTRANLQPPRVHSGWFGELTSDDVPPHIAFAFLDGDFYESILDSLRLVWPRLTPGGVITIDDYREPALPGVERAIHDFWQGRPPRVRHEASIAIIMKS